MVTEWSEQHQASATGPPSTRPQLQNRSSTATHIARQSVESRSEITASAEEPSKGIDLVPRQVLCQHDTRLAGAPGGDAGFGEHVVETGLGGADDAAVLAEG
ncbi:hypothetical protein GCM10022247_33600 [Allokutzneria multivorans]|uniref:Uncharacterized protein n=1 Tax=Allokutzneria multivorans TaxID=1142134 RepID=A0ABP7S9E9_9PSEU